MVAGHGIVLLSVGYQCCEDLLVNYIHHNGKNSILLLFLILYYNCTLIGRFCAKRLPQSISFEIGEGEIFALIIVYNG